MTVSFSCVGSVASALILRQKLPVRPKAAEKGVERRQTQQNSTVANGRESRKGGKIINNIGMQAHALDTSLFITIHGKGEITKA